MPSRWDERNSLAWQPPEGEYHRSQEVRLSDDSRVHSVRHISEDVTVRVEGNPVLRCHVQAQTLSCTGPSVLTISFPRYVLHEMNIGSESVVITLAEEAQ